jgi:hypothetical protein
MRRPGTHAGPNQPGSYLSFRPANSETLALLAVFPGMAARHHGDYPIRRIFAAPGLTS